LRSWRTLTIVSKLGVADLQSKGAANPRDSWMSHRHPSYYS
jgi:hypothetical protein